MRTIIVFSLLTLAVLTAIGGGVYAALGGVGKSAQSTDINLQKGLVGWWQLNGNTNDSSPYENDGTNHGATPGADRKGAANGAYSFDGTSSYISTPTAFPSGTSISISAWVNLSSTSESNAGIVSAVSATNYGTISFFPQGSTLQVGVTTTGWQSHNTTTTVSANQWYHVVVWADQSAQQYGMYLNGVSQFSTSFTGTLESATAFNIGLFSYQSRYFGGSISDVRIYNRVLNSGEVTALYSTYNSQAKAASGENGLVGWWKMAGNANDSSPFARDGTVTGSPTLASDREGAVNTAYSFSGTGQYISVPNFDNTIMTQGHEGASWTLSIWTTGGGQNGILFGKVGYNGGLLQNGSTYSFSLYSGSPYTNYTISTTGNTANWNLVTAVYSAGQMYLYLNGQLKSSRTGPATMYPYSNTLGIGSGGTNAWLSNATLSDARVYNRALSGNEIAAQYASYNSQISVGGSPNSSVQLSKGLVGDWPFNGNANDVTPFGNDGTVSGPVLTTDRKGRASSAYSANGTTDSITISAAAFPSSAITVSAWVNVSSFSSSYTRIMNDGWTNDGSWLFYLHPTTDAPIFGIVSTAGAQHNATCSSPAFTTGAWHLLTGTYDGSNVEMYMDGVLCGGPTAASSITLRTTGSVQIVAPSGGASPYIIDDARIWNRALSAAEVAALSSEYQ